MIPVVEIDEHGNIETLYTDEVDLYELGLVHSVKRASNVEFCEADQMWEVKLLDGTVIHRSKSREAAIEEEIKLMSPGGKHYDQT
jgi:hypothetical protein